MIVFGLTFSEHSYIYKTKIKLRSAIALNYVLEGPWIHPDPITESSTSIRILSNFQNIFKLDFPITNESISVIVEIIEKGALGGLIALKTGSSVESGMTNPKLESDNTV